VAAENIRFIEGDRNGVVRRVTGLKILPALRLLLYRVMHLRTFCNRRTINVLDDDDDDD